MDESPSLSNLPVDLAARCLEFSKFDEVHENAKQVSKALRSAARRALTRGRWRPMKLFSEESQAHASEIVREMIGSGDVSEASREIFDQHHYTLFNPP